MSIAYELHISEEEVLSWPPHVFAKWIAFFELKSEYQEAAAERARPKPRMRTRKRLR